MPGGAIVFTVIRGDHAAAALKPPDEAPQPPDFLVVRGDHAAAALKLAADFEFGVPEKALSAATTPRPH